MHPEAGMIFHYSARWVHPKPLDYGTEVVEDADMIDVKSSSQTRMRTFPPAGRDGSQGKSDCRRRFTDIIPAIWKSAGLCTGVRRCPISIRARLFAACSCAS